MAKKKTRTPATAATAKPKGFDIDTLSNEATQRTANRKVGKVFPGDFDVDVEKSYAESIANLDENASDYKAQVAHIESVLGAGLCKKG